MTSRSFKASTIRACVHVCAYKYSCLPHSTESLCGCPQCRKSPTIHMWHWFFTPSCLQSAQTDAVPPRNICPEQKRCLSLHFSWEIVHGSRYAAPDHTENTALSTTDVCFASTLPCCASSIRIEHVWKLLSTCATLLWRLWLVDYINNKNCPQTSCLKWVYCTWRFNT